MKKVVTVSMPKGVIFKLYTIQFTSELRQLKGEY